MRAVCSIPGCEGLVHGRGWCGQHYARWRRYGDPLKILTKRGMSLEERVWGSIEKTPECWRWTGTIVGGYGTISVKGTGSVRAYRLVYEMLVGPIPPGYEVDHLCHVAEECQLDEDCPHRACVRPDHLAAVPPRQNNLRSGSAAAQNAAKTHCPKGHPLSGENVRFTRRKNGGRTRICRACTSERKRLDYARRREAR
jgi:hypothetical protein